MKKAKAGTKKAKAGTTKSSALVVDRRALAALLCVSPRHLAELEANGVIVPLRRGRGGRASTYAVEAAVPAYLRHVTSAPASGDEREARRRRDLAQARFVELKIAKEEALLVPIDEVVTAGQSYTKAWTAKIRALPRQLVQRGVVSREREADVETILRALLMEISQWKTVADLQKVV